jgi:N-methylhydantoinase A/oxoprolinase/acetone carboxylase beta subunit
MVYGIGIDTGGTYTDAVLMNLKTLQVVRTSKRPTVHHDLKKGIIEALTEVVSNDESTQIARIAFSTTLATNAIAEGRGAGVGLIVIGQVKHLDLPVVSVRYVDGGHDHIGIL